MDFFKYLGTMLTKPSLSPLFCSRSLSVFFDTLRLLWMRLSTRLPCAHCLPMRISTLNFSICSLLGVVVLFYLSIISVIVV
jgi:hypothetical protein